MTVGADMLLAAACVCITVATHVLAVASATGADSRDSVGDSVGSSAAVTSGVVGLLTSMVLTLVVQRAASMAQRFAKSGAPGTDEGHVSYSWWAVATLPLIACWISLPVWHAVRGESEGSIDGAVATASAMLCAAGVFASIVSQGE